MAKTTLVNGTVVTSAYLNALAGHVHDDGTVDGHNSKIDYFSNVAQVFDNNPTPGTGWKSRATDRALLMDGLVSGEFHIWDVCGMGADNASKTPTDLGWPSPVTGLEYDLMFYEGTRVFHLKFANNGTGTATYYALPHDNAANWTTSAPGGKQFSINSSGELAASGVGSSWRWCGTIKQIIVPV
jgi:hypothetical protein